MEILRGIIIVLFIIIFFLNRKINKLDGLIDQTYETIAIKVNELIITDKQLIQNVEDLDEEIEDLNQQIEQIKKKKKKKK